MTEDQLIALDGRPPCPRPFSPAAIESQELLSLVNNGDHGLVEIAVRMIGHCLKYNSAGKTWMVYQGDQRPPEGGAYGVWVGTQAAPCARLTALMRTRLQEETKALEREVKEKCAVGPELVAKKLVPNKDGKLDDFGKTYRENLGEREWIVGAWAACHKAVKRVEAAEGILALVRLLKDHPGVAVEMTDFDADDTLLCVRNGVLDLSGAEPRLHEHNAGFLMIHQADVEFDAEATCPSWDRQMEACFPVSGSSDDMPEERVAYFQKIAGGCLVPNSLPEGVFSHYGDGSNGKSLASHTIMGILGSYATTVETDVLLKKGDVRITAGTAETERAQLRKARLALGAELGDGMLSASVLKKLTSRDRMSGRESYGTLVRFQPTHTLWVTSNYKQGIRETDNGTWRRIWLVPWEASFPVDPLMETELKAAFARERPGILNWMLAGLGALRREGLVVPKGIFEEKEEYRKSEDVLSAFLDFALEPDPGSQVYLKTLWNAYSAWCHHERERQRFQNREMFYKAIETRLVGHTVTKDRKGLKFVPGLALASEVHAWIDASDSQTRWGGRA